MMALTFALEDIVGRCVEFALMNIYLCKCLSGVYLLASCCGRYGVASLVYDRGTCVHSKNKIIHVVHKYVACFAFKFKVIQAALQIITDVS